MKVTERWEVTKLRGNGRGSLIVEKFSRDREAESEVYEGRSNDDAPD